jgi:hypothetical protein
MGLACEDNFGGVVLFSTSRPERIIEMVRKPIATEILGAAREEITRLVEQIVPKSDF